MDSLKQIEDQQLLEGGARIPCKTKAGEDIEIFVRQMSVSEFGAYLQAESKGDIPLLEKVTGQTKEVLEALSLKSFEELLEADRSQNFYFARQQEKRAIDRLARQMEQLKRTSPEVYKEITFKQHAAMESALSSLSQSVDLVGSVGTAPPTS